MVFVAEQTERGMRARVPGAGSGAVGGVAAFDIDGDAGVDAAIGTLDHV